MSITYHEIPLTLMSGGCMISGEGSDKYGEFNIGTCDSYNEVKKPYNEGWTLCFQYCLYSYSTGKTENGYRFIWRRPNGTLQAARGQARIPKIDDIESLISKANQAGWGN